MNLAFTSLLVPLSCTLMLFLNPYAKRSLYFKFVWLRLPTVFSPWRLLSLRGGFVDVPLSGSFDALVLYITCVISLYSFSRTYLRTIFVLKLVLWSVSEVSSFVTPSKLWVPNSTVSLWGVCSPFLFDRPLIKEKARKVALLRVRSSKYFKGSHDMKVIRCHCFLNSQPFGWRRRFCVLMWCCLRQRKYRPIIINSLIW